jgi:hypothetical protein
VAINDFHIRWAGGKAGAFGLIEGADVTEPRSAQHGAP